MHQEAIGTRFGVSVGVAQIEVYASAAARATVLEAERLAQVAAGLPPEVVCRPTRLAELLVTDRTSRAGLHAVLRDVAEAQGQLHALQAAAISRLAELQPAQRALPGARADDPADVDRPDDWVADEVAVVLGISVGSASVLVAKQRALVEQLPRIWAAAADGVIDVRRCQVLVDALADRKHSAGGGLPDDVVDTIAAQGLGWIAEGVGPTTLTDRIGGAVIAADPAEADRRAERRKRRQNVTSAGQGDGLASLRTELVDAADVAEELEVIDALAAMMRRNGDKRPMGQLRVAAHHQLVTRPWETLPAEVARARWQLRMQVDLADLDDLGPLLNRPDDTTAPAAPPAADRLPAVDDSSQPTAASAPGTAPPGLTDPGGPPVDADPAGDARMPQGSSPSDGTSGSDGISPSGDSASSDDGALPDGTCLVDEAALLDGTGLSGGSGVGAIGGLAVSPVAVAELLARYDALLASGPRGRVDGGEVWFEILDATGRLRALTTPAEARAAVRRGTGLGPPPPIDGYEPSAAQIRFVKARDRHCRFPGCSRPAEYVDLDHVIPYRPRRRGPAGAERAPGGDGVLLPAAGGPSCVTNLVCLCRRHHRLKTHAPGWVFAMDPDGTLHVTPPGGRTRTTRPAGIAEVDMSTPTHLDTLTDLLGPTPQRFRSPSPEQRASRRAAAGDRARLAAEIEAELDAALARQAAGQVDDLVDPTTEDDPPPF